MMTHHERVGSRLRHFSIEAAKQYVLPRVREALAINPDLKVMIAPERAGMDEDQPQPDPGSAPAALLFCLRTISPAP
jgi:hypothetical protein